MTVSQLDSLKRAPTSAPQSRASQRRSWLILPSLLIGFALLTLFLFGERIRPRLAVQTAPALLLASTGASEAAAPDAPTQMLSQASGWIEPDPYPIRVPVRVDGLVESVEVLAGESVVTGQLLATLDPADFEFQLQALSGALLAAEASKKEKEKAITRAAAECRRSKAGVDAATARLREQEDRLRRVLALDPGVVPEDERLIVEREVAVSKADLAAAEAEWEGHMAHQEVEKAGVETAQAQIVELTAQVARAKLDLQRTEIRSPIDGVVMHRYAVPGGKRMRGMDDPESATVVSLYNPEKLQVRVDVPLSDVAALMPGMSAKIQLSAFPNLEFKGEITRIVGEADITRNTLQVKVAVTDPDKRMRPEMLCRVEFFALPNIGKDPGSVFRTSGNLWIPEQALQASGGVWVVDPVKGRASYREVEKGTESKDGYVSVRKGLRPGERVVLGTPAGIKEGIRVKEISGERS